MRLSKPQEELEELLDMFDLIGYLEDKGIPYYHSGSKNTSAGWYSMACPFCGDRTNHLGINLSSHVYSCWKCAAKGNFISLIKALENCSFHYAINIAKRYVVSDFKHLIKRVRVRAEQTMLPSGVSDKFLPIHDRFIEKRRYDRATLQRLYDIQAIGPTLDDWKFRILIPVIMDGELQTYVGRDTTGKLEVPYKNAPTEKSIRPAKECLYGIDDVGDTIVLVEGILDKWRVGKGAVCTFGTMMTARQIYALSGVKRAVMLFDKDALKKAEGLAHSITSVVPRVDIVELEDGDPDDLGDDDVWELRRELGI